MKFIIVNVKEENLRHLNKKQYSLRTEDSGVEIVISRSKYIILRSK